MKRISKKLIYIFLFGLVFISCKKDTKVIDSFGHMNEKLEESVSLTAVKNAVFKGILERNLEMDSVKYKPMYKRLTEAQKVSNEFYYYLEALKDSIYGGTLEPDEARSSYSKLSGSKFLDDYFFEGNKLTPRGKEFLDKINEYKENFEKALGKGYGTVATMVSSRFRTRDLVDYSGNIIPWINFKFESFPAMASIFNISQMQYDIRLIEQELIESMNSGEFEKEFAMRNYTGIVRLDKGAYYPDENITGRIVLGRYDESARPFDININGSKVSDKYGTEGAVLLEFNAPSIGEHALNGEFKVMYDGTPVTIPFNSTYKVVSRENIVEKIVYKTEYVEKPVYIDRPVETKKVASTPKATPVSNEPEVPADAKTRKYYTSDGPVSMEIEGLVNNEKGNVTMLKTTLRQAKVGAIRTQDNKTFGISSFKVKVPGQLTVYVEGDGFSEEAIRTIDKAQPGQLVTIFDIKAVDESGVRQGKVKEVKIDLK
jgi:gliding motility-associated protein GldM